ncbi:hypothetical protein AJ85_14120 [Alkalihalobacillus alcalophilus ATCC 27647 = CGMCC 1.3604]|uniref:Uncharacterized protein n=1 Tax=Alkalihalobacillus alcalophilus ATCC 27647 = CGMCC 1.3604 TaxID=1218173 RepID=A0A094XFA2_ALKAL|nr:hypothetical protein [Alkalihalobacillus alcalophilus]KGA97455.1 hypothetical protein BALCAV_0210270 [Alkalihalobacillus alcalophilus ATCC 27647 = CGMCC 1.3604]MED1562225.1 hypothetical protein [Alkalihalobacillus alcalophilus]THG89979.1 hypothetical protein AJ85_14120 [Alkalihalobacillus alcalophilus ATCC 27647 = CGMCC 1.3604]
MIALLIVTLLFFLIGSSLFFLGVVSGQVFIVLLFSFSFFWFILTYTHLLVKGEKKRLNKKDLAIPEKEVAATSEKLPNEFSNLGSVLLLLGMTIFGGWFLASFTNNTHHISPEKYVEWRISVSAMMFAYLGFLYVYAKRKRRAFSKAKNQ